MNELINRLIANNFADLEGLQLTGTVPVKQELINEALAELLRQGQAPASSAPSSAGAGSSGAPKIDPKALLGFVRRAEVTAQEGRLTLYFDVRVGGGE